MITGETSNYDTGYQINYQETLDKLFEYKKLNAKLENELIIQQNEKNELISLYNQLKDSYDNCLKNINELNEKILILENEKKAIKEKYENENEKLKNYMNSQQLEYQRELKNFENMNESVLSAKIKSQLELEYNLKLNEKEKENLKLIDEINRLEKKNNEIENMYELYKNDTELKIENLNKKYNNDLRELILNNSNKNINLNLSKDKEETDRLIIAELKIQNNKLKNDNENLNSLIDKLKTQNNNILIATKIKDETHLN